MSEDDGKIGSELLTEIVENQLSDNNPLKVKETLMRLCMSGVEREEALMFIGCALAQEMYSVVNEGETFDEERYCSYLATLPEMPWLSEDLEADED